MPRFDPSRIHSEPRPLWKIMQVNNRMYATLNSMLVYRFDMANVPEKTPSDVLGLYPAGKPYYVMRHTVLADALAFYDAQKHLEPYAYVASFVNPELGEIGWQSIKIDFLVYSINFDPKETDRTYTFLFAPNATSLYSERKSLAATIVDGFGGVMVVSELPWLEMCFHRLIRPLPEKQHWEELFNVAPRKLNPIHVMGAVRYPGIFVYAPLSPTELHYGNIDETAYLQVAMYVNSVEKLSDFAVENFYLCMKDTIHNNVAAESSTLVYLNAATRIPPVVRKEDKIGHSKMIGAAMALEYTQELYITIRKHKLAQQVAARLKFDTAKKEYWLPDDTDLETKQNICSILGFEYLPGFKFVLTRIKRQWYATLKFSKEPRWELDMNTIVLSGMPVYECMLQPLPDTTPYQPCVMYASPNAEHVRVVRNITAAVFWEFLRVRALKYGQMPPEKQNIARAEMDKLSRFSLIARLAKKGEYMYDFYYTIMLWFFLQFKDRTTYEKMFLPHAAHAYTPIQCAGSDGIPAWSWIAWNKMDFREIMAQLKEPYDDDECDAMAIKANDYARFGMIAPSLYIYNFRGKGDRPAKTFSLGISMPIAIVTTEYQLRIEDLDDYYLAYTKHIANAGALAIIPRIIAGSQYDIWQKDRMICVD